MSATTLDRRRDPPTPRPMIRMLAAAYALTIANLNYCQPLLPNMSRSFPSTSATAMLPASGQIGYVLGLVLVVPLGDLVARRPLVCVLLCTDATAAVATATAPTVEILLAAGAVIGVTSAGVVNVLVAYAADLATPARRGWAVATMLGAGMTGILVSRTAAGLIAQQSGWRPVYLIAAAITLTLAGVLAWLMASTPPPLRMRYRDQLRETALLAVRVPMLARRSLIGACVAAAFSAFWATVAFLLAGPRYHYSDSVIGLFGLLGLAGVFAVRMIGRYTGRGRRHAVGVLLAVGLAAFVLMGIGGSHLGWLLAAIVLMDAAVRGTHLLNATVVYGVSGDGRSRVASVYMTGYTLGGVVGAAAGATAYRCAGWAAVSATGATFMLAGLAVWAFHHWVAPADDSTVLEARAASRS
ncbi:MFS transporter [Nocardia sp. NPDC051570]|uniref:MFS transporter n=1 Tax=Nocardia sp. NPDC051570 TaxID=3364324 RepID=UPI0037BDD692